MLYIKALHIIFIVTWFAGLFYIVRLFVYHREAQEKPELEKNILSEQFKIMQRRLWYGITWPSAIFTFIFGPWLVYENPVFLYQAYFIVKLLFVFALGIYHVYCHKIFKEAQKDIFPLSSFKLRILNEVASILLVAIVFLIVVKSNSGLLWLLIGIVALVAAMYIAIQIYKKKRSE
ncbi:MAG: CopD family protein [Bacteroidetes bacterium]|nr:CopD family protein [Bacteroidota bacterium]